MRNKVSSCKIPLSFLKIYYNKNYNVSIDYSGIHDRGCEPGAIPLFLFANNGMEAEALWIFISDQTHRTSNTESFCCLEASLNFSLSSNKHIALKDNSHSCV